MMSAGECVCWWKSWSICCQILKGKFPATSFVKRDLKPGFAVSQGAGADRLNISIFNIFYFLWPGTAPWIELSIHRFSLSYCICNDVLNHQGTSLIHNVNVAISFFPSISNLMFPPCITSFYINIPWFTSLSQSLFGSHLIYDTAGLERPQ